MITKKKNIKPITKKEKQWIKGEEKRLISKLPRLKETIQPNANFINLTQGYFNKGKHKGTPVNHSTLEYLQWILKNIELNKGELSLINKLIEEKSKQQ